MWKLLAVILVPLSVFGQQLVYSVKIDTTQFEIPYLSNCYVVQGPSTQTPIARFNSPGLLINDEAVVLHKKNTNEFHILSFTGDVGTITVPKSLAPTGYVIYALYVSQTIINADDNWEYIVVMLDSTAANRAPLFKVCDCLGNQLLADTGIAYYGFDGQNTYVFTVTSSDGSGSTYSNTLKAWQFRTNIGSSIQPLAKSSAIGRPSIMSLMPSGGLRVTLQPAGGGQTSVRIIDMLGRLVFNRTIADVKSPTTFMVPPAEVPKSPFIAKVNNSGGTYLKEEIPVR